MLRGRRIPDLTREQAVPYRIKCLDRTHTNRKSTPDEWIVLLGPGWRPFWGILFRMLDVFAGHQEYPSGLFGAKSQFGSLRIRDSDFFFMLRSRGCSPYCNSITSTLNFRSNTRQTMFIRETSFFALALLLTISVTVSAQQLTAQTKRQKRAT